MRSRSHFQEKQSDNHTTSIKETFPPKKNESISCFSKGLKSDRALLAEVIMTLVSQKQKRKSEDVIIERRSPQRQGAGVNGWVNKISDFHIGDNGVSRFLLTAILSLLTLTTWLLLYVC